MLNFDYVKLEDKNVLKPIMKQSECMGNETTFGTLYIWGEINHRKVCYYKDTIFSCFGDKGITYTLPLGAHDLKDSISVIISDAKERNQPFKMWGITEEQIERLEQLMPDTFDFTMNRNYSDYIYKAEDLINLSGRKFHGKRNHLAKFNRTYEYNYEDITLENLSECISIAQKWREDKEDNGENDLYKEDFALSRTFNDYEKLGFSGGLIKINDKPVAFTIGEEINSKVFLIHFEKALNGYDGLYTAINHEFAVRHFSKYQYINREEDLGIEGLRKAKLSYNPSIILNKYTATLKGDIVK